MIAAPYPWAAVLLVLAGCAVPAQAALDGRWIAVFASAGSDEQRATVVVHSDNRGTWTSLGNSPHQRLDACAGKPMRITTVPGPSSTVTLLVEGDLAAGGCAPRKARLTIVDGHTLEGEFDDGRVLRLIRQ